MEPEDEDANEDRSGVDVFEVEVGGEQLVVVSMPIDRVDAVADVLSAAEREVALAAASGLSNADIAANRGTSSRTIANQLAKIYRKLGIGSRAELAVRLRRT